METESIIVKQILARPLDTWRDMWAMDILADVGLLFQHRQLPLDEDKRIALGTIMRRVASLAGGGDDG